MSLPELYADVKRAEKVTLSAFDLEGKPIRLELDGLFARAAQHEVDHLDGKLFVDRLSTIGELGVREALRRFEQDFADRRAHGEIPSDEQIAARLMELEKQRT